MKKIGAVILAAGASRRLGRPKQLVPFRGLSLVRRSVEAALAASCSPVIVVGNPHTNLARTLAGLEMTLAINECWWEGLGTSIRVGVSTLQAEAPAVSAAVLLVCDQPMVTSPLIQDLIQAHTETGHSIAACRYGEALGVPALFGRYWFPVLSRLPGDAGAKRIIETHRDAVAVVEFPAGALDIDTPGDLGALQQLEQGPEISQPSAAA